MRKNAVFTALRLINFKITYRYATIAAEYFNRAYLICPLNIRAAKYR